MRKKMFYSLFDQSVVSAFNFLINFYLIKSWSPESFGLFSIISAIALFTTMLQNALINTPLAVHYPIVSSANEQALLLRVFSTTNLGMTIILLIVSYAGLKFWLDVDKQDIVFPGALFISVYFFREYYRAQLAVDGRLKNLLFVDLFYVISVIVVLLIAHLLEKDLMFNELSSLLRLMSIFGLLSILIYAFPASSYRLMDYKREALLVFPKQLQEIKWSFLGVVTTDIQNRGYIYIAAAFFGPVTVATLQAGRIFFGPLNLLTSAWARVARPRLASLAANNDKGLFKKVLFQAISAFAVFNVVFLLSLIYFWHDLTNFLFADKYIGLGLIVAGWGLANFVFQIRSCLSVAVQAIRQFKKLTLATIYGAILSMLVLMLACLINLPDLMVVSVIIGELVAVVVIVFILNASIRGT